MVEDVGGLDSDDGFEYYAHGVLCIIVVYTTHYRYYNKSNIQRTIVSFTHVIGTLLLPSFYICRYYFML